MEPQRDPPPGPEPVPELDLSLAALFAGYALNDEVARLSLIHI